MNKNARISLLFEYLAAGAAALCGLNALQLSIADVTAIGFLMWLTITGIVFSWFVRCCLPIPQKWKDKAIYIDVVISLTAVIFQEQLADLLLGSRMNSEDIHPAVGLAWLVMLRSFTLIGDGALMFEILPAIAMFGLASTWINSSTILSLFWVYLSSAILLLILQRRRTLQPVKQKQKQGWELSAALWSGGLILMIALFSMVVTPIAQGGMLIIGKSIGMPTVSKGAMSGVFPRQDKSQSDVPVGTGPVNSTDQELFRVKSPLPFYWRAHVYDEYTGHGWKKDELKSSVKKRLYARTRYDNSKMWNVTPLRPLPVAKSLRTITAEVQFKSLMNASLYAPEGSNTLSSNTLSTIYTDDDGCLSSGSTNGSDISYTLEIIPPLSDADSLRHVHEDPEKDITNFDDITLECWPKGASAEIRASADRLDKLAKEIVRGIDTRYDKVRAIERYIDQQCIYNTQAGAFPKDEDVVEFFLNRQREGYCDAFATSLAMLCRHVGIPARVASGFLPGNLDTDSGEFIIQDAHRHLWTEIYFCGIGWVTFDATQNAREGQGGERGQSAETPMQKIVNFAAWTKGAALQFVLVSFFGLIILRSLRFSRKSKRLLLNWSFTPSAKVMKTFDKFCSALAKTSGLKRREDQTPIEYWHQSESSIPDDIRVQGSEVVKKFNDFLYSNQSFTAQEVKELAASVKKFFTQVKVLKASK